MIGECPHAIQYFLDNANMPIEKVEELGGVTEENNYGFPMYCEVSDQVIALTNLAFTTALVVDIGPVTYAQRFCFEDERDAIIQMMEWHKRGCSPYSLPQGWIACRGLSQREVKAGYIPDYGQTLLWMARELHKQEHGTNLQYYGDILALQDILASGTMTTVKNVRHVAAFLKHIGEIV